MSQLDLEVGVVAKKADTAPMPGTARTAWGNRWFAQVQHAGKRHYLGTYDSPEEAHEVYLRAKLKLTGDSCV